jgi:hypothetical protein
VAYLPLFNQACAICVLQHGRRSEIYFTKPMSFNFTLKNVAFIDQIFYQTLQCITFITKKLQNINNSKSCPEVNLWFCTLSENATFFNVKLKDIGFVK